MEALLHQERILGQRDATTLQDQGARASRAKEDTGNHGDKELYESEYQIEQEHIFFDVDSFLFDLSLFTE